MLLDLGFVTQITDVAQQLQAALEAGGETQVAAALWNEQRERMWPNRSTGSQPKWAMSVRSKRTAMAIMRARA
jgi:hypothetical protein